MTKYTHVEGIRPDGTPAWVGRLNGKQTYLAYIRAGYSPETAAARKKEVLAARKIVRK